jgi:hypothetical protein
MDLNEVIKYKNFLYYNKNNKLLDLLFLNFRIDFYNIKEYYINFISLNKISENKIVFLFLIPFFYSILIINNLFLQFFLFKFVFYTVKYVLKYIFLFIDFVYRNYLPRNKYLNIIPKLFYNIIFKLCFNTYIFVFYAIPKFIFINFWISLVNRIKFIANMKAHLFLDVIEGIPSMRFIRSIRYTYYSIEKLINKMYKNYFRKEARIYYFEKWKNSIYIIYKFPYILYNINKAYKIYILTKYYFLKKRSVYNILFTIKLIDYYKYITSIHYYYYKFFIMFLLHKSFIFIKMSIKFIIFCIVSIPYYFNYIKYKFFKI